MTRPLLIPGLPRLWRTPVDLQLGADPSRAVSVRLPEPATAQVLDLLDGTRSERAVLIRAAELDIPPDQAYALIETLRAAGLVRPATDVFPSGLPPEARRRLLGEAAALALAPTRAGATPAEMLRRRRLSRVVINGFGRLGAPIAVTLAEAGIGHIEADMSGVVGPGELAGGPLGGADIGRSRREAISDAVLRAGPGLLPPAVRRPTAPTRTASASPAVELVVRLDRDELPDPLADPRPYLAVTIREGIPVIGPLVPAVGGPCLHCLDLHRLDRDPDWPGPAPRPRVEPCTVVNLLAATAYASSEILAHLDGGEPRTLGAAVEIVGPGGARRRSWPAHPACPCARQADLLGH